jgi:hypothetical protein
MPKKLTRKEQSQIKVALVCVVIVTIFSWLNTLSFILTSGLANLVYVINALTTALCMLGTAFCFSLWQESNKEVA